uniref:Uncharacterized protein n=1 Tax=Oryza meridionalis TaxID=40149 RepID=A0A0E0CGA7_9ORYZ
MEKWPLACTTTTDSIAAVGKGEGRRETKTVARGVCNMVVTSIHTWSLSYLSHLVTLPFFAITTTAAYCGDQSCCCLPIFTWSWKKAEDATSIIFIGAKSFKYCR